MDTLQQFMSLRLKYLQSFLHNELKGNGSNKLSMTPIVKAHLTFFTTEDNPTMIHQLSALDLVIPCDSWAEVWSESLCSSSSSKELVEALAKSLKIDINQFVKKMNIGMKADYGPDDKDKNMGKEKVNKDDVDMTETTHVDDAEARFLLFNYYYFFFKNIYMNTIYSMWCIIQLTTIVLLVSSCCY